MHAAPPATTFSMLCALVPGCSNVPITSPCSVALLLPASSLPRAYAAATWCQNKWKSWETAGSRSSSLAAIGKQTKLLATNKSLASASGPSSRRTDSRPKPWHTEAMLSIKNYLQQLPSSSMKAGPVSVSALALAKRDGSRQLWQGGASIFQFDYQRLWFSEENLQAVTQAFGWMKIWMWMSLMMMRNVEKWCALWATSQL